MDDIRYIKLHNSGWFVARIHILYKTPQRDAHGNISYPAEFSEWKPSGYSDICVLAERTVDMVNDTNFTDGTIVKLKAFIVAGSDRTAAEQYEFRRDSGKTAKYNVSRGTRNAKLVLKAYICQKSTGVRRPCFLPALRGHVSQLSLPQQGQNAPDRMRPARPR